MLKCNARNIYKAIFVIIGTIIGAGFASGQEIHTFFNRYGIQGIIGLILSVTLIGVIIYKTFKVILENKICTYQDFIMHMMPDKLRNSNILVFAINNIINIFLLISFNIMIAGFSTYFLQELYISKWIGAIIIAILACATFSKSIDGVIKINTYLIPTLIILIIFLGIKKINTMEVLNIVDNKSLYWIISSVLYASYNSITLIPILINLKKYINTKREARTNVNSYSYNNANTINNNILAHEYIFR